MIVFCDDPCHRKKYKVAEFERRQGLWMRGGVIPIIADGSLYIAVPASSMLRSRGQVMHYSCKWCPLRGHRQPCDRWGRQQFLASLRTLQKPLSLFADELGISEVTVAQVKGVLSNVT